MGRAVLAEVAGFQHPGELGKRLRAARRLQRCQVGVIPVLEGESLGLDRVLGEPRPTSESWPLYSLILRQLAAD